MEASIPNMNELALAEEFEVGATFYTVLEFYESFSFSALEKGVGFDVLQRNKTSISIVCKKPECSFKVSARFVNTAAKCIVKQMRPFHSCVVEIGNQSNTGSLKKVIKRLNLTDLTPKSLKSIMRNDYQCEVPYNTAWSAIRAARIFAGTILENSYELLPSLSEKIRNNGDFSEYLCDRNGAFKRFFIMWNASKDFFLILENYCTLMERF